MILQLFRTRLRLPLLVNPLVRIHSHLAVVGCLPPVIAECRIGYKGESQAYAKGSTDTRHKGRNYRGRQSCQGGSRSCESDHRDKKRSLSPFTPRSD